MWGKNSNFRGLGKTYYLKITHIPLPPQTSSGHVNHLGGGRRKGFDNLVNVIHQQNGWHAFIKWWFLRLKFCISRLKIRR